MKGVEGGDEVNQRVENGTGHNKYKRLEVC